VERYGLLQFNIGRTNPSIGNPLEWLQLQSLWPNIVGVQTTHDSRGLHVRMRPLFEKLDRQRNISYSSIFNIYHYSNYIYFNKRIRRKKCAQKDTTKYRYVRPTVITGSMHARMISLVEITGAMGFYGEEVRNLY
jgi:hypothetical protein